LTAERETSRNGTDGRACGELQHSTTRSAFGVSGGLKLIDLIL
jgi:hypothetical protein